MNNRKAMVTIDNLNTCISVKNLDSAVNWYRDVLGFRVLQEHDFTDLSARVVYLESNGVEIELVETKDVTPFRRSDPPVAHVAIQGISQLSFRTTDMEKLVRHLKDRSIEIAFGPVDSEVLKLKAVFFRDCEGNIIEFIERYGS